MGVKLIIKGSHTGGNFTPGWLGQNNFKSAKTVVSTNTQGFNVGMNFHMFNLGTQIPLGLFVENHTVKWEVTGANWPTIVYFWDAISKDTTLAISDENTVRSLANNDPSRVNIYWAMTCGPVVLKNGQDGNWDLPNVGKNNKTCRVAIGFKSTDKYTLYFMYHSSATLADLKAYAQAYGIDNLICGDGGASAQLYAKNVTGGPWDYNCGSRVVPNVPMFKSYSVVDHTTF